MGRKVGHRDELERRISRVRAAISPIGAAKPDWEIAINVALSLAKKLGRTTPFFDYTNCEAIWNEHRQTTAGRDLDITGLSYQILEDHGPNNGPIQWAQNRDNPSVHEKSIPATENGKAKFIRTEYVAPSEKVSARYPFLLNTGRLRDQWHGMSRTGTVAQLYAHAPEPSIQLSTNDMQTRFLTEGDLVEVSNARENHLARNPK